MSSKKQIEANRRNAQNSTGPRTPEGKARASLNALKHGLTAAQILAPSESADDYESHATSLRDHFAPADPFESLLVDQIIVAAWRLRRSRILERFILEQRATDIERACKRDGPLYTDPADYLTLAFREDCNCSTALDKLSRHEVRIERAFYRALHELDRRRSVGGRVPSPAPPFSQDGAPLVQPSPPILQNEPNSPLLPTGQVLDAQPLTTEPAPHPTQSDLRHIIHAAQKLAAKQARRQDCPPACATQPPVH